VERGMFNELALYMLTVFLGLAILSLIVLPLMYVALTRRNVFRFGFNMTEALIMAFATSSRFLAYFIVAMIY
jgi:Na+/H+-dicarboxylate symporter